MTMAAPSTSKAVSFDDDTSLETATYRGKSLTTLPDTLYSRKALTSLDVSNNALADLPETIGGLTALRRLDLSRNSLTQLPIALCTLNRLEHLDVRHNKLTTLPAGLGSNPAAELQLFATPQAPPGLTLALPSRAAHTHFRDTQFPATAASLFRDPSKPWPGHPSPTDVKWLRPHEITKATGAPPPSLFVAGNDSSDVVQGILGDCWLLSAIAVIAQDAARLRHLFAYLAVEGSRAGCIVLQLYFRNAWRRVTIDDRLPCASDGSLLYAHSIDGNEFWVALLEKAFAKLCGSYEALISGFADSAMRTLTGGAPMRLRLRPTPTPAAAAVQGEAVASGGGDGGTWQTAITDPHALWSVLKRWNNEGSPIGCAYSTSGLSNEEVEDATSKLSPSHQGILFAHAYGLEKLAEVAGRRLLRLRNPWGRGEWSGAWGDESAEWTSELLLQVRRHKHAAHHNSTPSLSPSSLLTCSTALYCLL